MQRRYDGRRVLVTGAGSGIGRGIALRLLAEGAELVAADIAETGLKETADAAGDTASRLRTVQVDVSNPESVRTAVDTAVETLGGLDVLVNAAGIMRTAHTHEMPFETWNQVIAVNLTGTFLMVQAAVPTLLQGDNPVIVNFSSTSAFGAHPYMAAYSASKGGVNAMTHAIALEYAKQGLRAVNIVPGGITTGITTNLETPPDADWSLFSRLLGWLNGGALGSPDDVAGAVAMVASEDGRYITGSEIRVDGGALM
ncbi:NAD(P)-dependent dehydrogenase (short-subunit alcohol dehydrogenase family) [Nocardia transvalensis]|uniref:NAD(P)-dependent dehydrogenase (Short-subunit alcohol dehydrogenase family) n=1 Tax=Nocardia transvalensis TaxID=37333 RepID=A0A7W9UH25_9NOCA|nr:SDR family NAD(P)-dependent oxidoreductase [Nocardia transvalensis]MBB5912736.1 NAD(P)-dependent dehydrogenase (short-subunit alcohol dehydrogenase family) [Nocardia transvalensis]